MQKQVGDMLQNVFVTGSCSDGFSSGAWGVDGESATVTSLVHSTLPSGIPFTDTAQIKSFVNKGKGYQDLFLDPSNSVF